MPLRHGGSGASAACALRPASSVALLRVKRRYSSSFAQSKATLLKQLCSPRQGFFRGDAWPGEPGAQDLADEGPLAVVADQGGGAGAAGALGAEGGLGAAGALGAATMTVQARGAPRV